VLLAGKTVEKPLERGLGAAELDVEHAMRDQVSERGGESVLAGEEVLVDT
jgi:hypothetical protein